MVSMPLLPRFQAGSLCVTASVLALALAAPLSAGGLQHEIVVPTPVGKFVMMVCIYYDEDPDTGVDTDDGVMVYVAFFGPEGEMATLGLTAPSLGWGSWHAGSQSNCPQDPPVLTPLMDFLERLLADLGIVLHLEGKIPPVP